MEKSEFYTKVIDYNNMLELINSAQKGDLISKNKLIKLNIGLVNKAILKFLPSGLDREDLIQLGCIGLLKAINRFKPSLGFMFSSYAVPMIDGEIKRFLRDDGIIKVSRELKYINWKVKKYKDKYFKTTGKEISLDELSLALDIDKDKIQASLIALSPVEFFDIYDSKLDGDIIKIDLSNNLVKEDEIDYTILVELNEIIDDLPELESKVIKLRYFNDFTQEKVGKILGISQVQVSRIERKALKLLQKEYKI